MAGKHKFLGITAHCQRALFLQRNGTSLGGLSQSGTAVDGWDLGRMQDISSEAQWRLRYLEQG